MGQPGYVTGRYVTLSHEGWYYLGVLTFVLVGAILRDVNLLLVVACMMLGPLVLGGFLAFSTLKQLSITRRLPRVVVAGERWNGHVTVTNRRHKLASWALVVEDQVAGAPQRLTNATYIPFIAAGSECDGHFEGPKLDRGAHALGPLTIETRVPFGLVAARGNCKVEDTLLVIPRIGSLHPQWKAILGCHTTGLAQAGHRSGRSEGDYYGLRDWQHQDSRKWIHWRTTARRNQLTVREYQQPEDFDLLIALDLGDCCDAHGTPREEVETMISFVATVVVDQCRRGNGQLTVVVGGQTIRAIHGPQNAHSLDAILSNLAQAQPRHATQLEDLLDTVNMQRSAARHGLLVSRHASKDIDSWSPHLTAQGWLRDVTWIDPHTPGFQEAFQLNPSQSQGSHAR